MKIAPNSSPCWRMVPLMAATAYAILVVTLWGGGHAAEIATLSLGYASGVIAVFAFVASVVLIHQIVLRIRRGEPSSAAALVQDFLTDRCRADRGLSLWQPLLTFVIVMTTFTFFKQAVLPTAGFESGPVIAAADHALFGADPWRITHAVLASPWWSQIIDLAYHAWFAPMMLGVVICAFARPGSVLAWRYMLAYCLMWIVEGSILAYDFPAAGPVFFAQFHEGAGRFTELTHLLATQDAALRESGAPGLTALLFQHHLLRVFQDGAVVLGGGISAMPSLHNAMAVLIACAAWHISAGCGRAMTAYAGIIWIGSVHLGWHYALDGVVAFTATMGLWKLTGGLSQAAQRGVPLRGWRTSSRAVGCASARTGLRSMDETP